MGFIHHDSFLNVLIGLGSPEEGTEKIVLHNVGNSLVLKDPPDHGEFHFILGRDELSHSV